MARGRELGRTVGGGDVRPAPDDGDPPRLRAAAADHPRAPARAARASAGSTPCSCCRSPASSRSGSRTSSSGGCSSTRCTPSRCMSARTSASATARPATSRRCARTATGTTSPWSRCRSPATPAGLVLDVRPAVPRRGRRRQRGRGPRPAAPGRGPGRRGGQARPRARLPDREPRPRRRTLGDPADGVYAGLARPVRDGDAPPGGDLASAPTRPSAAPRAGSRPTCSTATTSSCTASTWPSTSWRGCARPSRFDGVEPLLVQMAEDVDQARAMTCRLVTDRGTGTQRATRATERLVPAARPAVLRRGPQDRGRRPGPRPVGGRAGARLLRLAGAGRPAGPVLGGSGCCSRSAVWLLLLAVWAVANLARRQRALERPRRVGVVEVAVFALGPAAVVAVLRRDSDLVLVALLADLTRAAGGRRRGGPRRRPDRPLGADPHLRRARLAVPAGHPGAADAAAVHDLPVHQHRGVAGLLGAARRPVLWLRWCSSARSRSASCWSGCPRRWPRSTTTAGPGGGAAGSRGTPLAAVRTTTLVRRPRAEPLDAAASGSTCCSSCWSPRPPRCCCWPCRCWLFFLVFGRVAISDERRSPPGSATEHRTTRCCSAGSVSPASCSRCRSSWPRSPGSTSPSTR